MRIACALLVLFATYTECARILGFFSFPSVSHQVVYQPIWRELSLRGHEVTVLTPSPLHDPALLNLTEIDLSYTYQIVTDFNMQNSLYKDTGMTSVVDGFFRLCEEVAKRQLEHAEVQDLIADTTRNFDVILVECFHPIAYVFATKYRVPVIGVSSMNTFLNSHFAVGNPVHPVLNPDLFYPAYDNFYQRLTGTFYAVWFRLWYNFHILPRTDKIARKFFGNDIPYIGDVERNVSLLFLNINPILHSVRPNVPAIIELGQMHFKPPKPLPSDLKEILDEATEGVIYFSLGSNVRSANLTRKVREVIIDALSELPYKIFWKWEADHLERQPKNVVRRKWLPQQDILSHPNVKAFLTQGGLQSMEEAITRGVPLIGMPFFADQPLNVKKMVDLGIARRVDPLKMTKDDLKEAIIDVAENKKYRKRIKEVRSLILDQPMSGLEKAVWWTEYVIRHKGAHHLRNPALNMPWYQYFLVDVIGFTLLACCFIIYGISKLIDFVNNLGRSIRIWNKLKSM